MVASLVAELSLQGVWASLAAAHRLNGVVPSLVAPWCVGSLPWPVSPGLAGKFFTTEPPGKPQTYSHHTIQQSPSLIFSQVN